MLKKVKPWRIANGTQRSGFVEVPQGVAAAADDRELPRRVGEVPRPGADVQGLELVVGDGLAQRAT